jgi:hypothetical protein
MTTLDFASPGLLETSVVRQGIAMIQLHDELWRLTLPEGDLLGYIERFTVQEGHRYRAKRRNVLRQRFLAMGEFWSMDDAIDCFRVS